MPPNPLERAAERWPGLLAGLVGLAGGVLVTAVAFEKPTKGLIGDWVFPDTLSNHWVYVWVANQLAAGGSLLHNAEYYSPIGDAPFLAGNASGALLSAPFILAFGHPLGLNLYILLVLAAGVAAGAALARTIGAKPVPALLSGIGLSLSPYVLNELSCARFAQVPVWEMAGGLAVWMQALKVSSPRKGALAGFLIGLAGVEYFYYGWFVGLAAVATTVTCVFARPSRLVDPNWWKTVATGALVAILTVAPLLAVFLHGWSTVVGSSEAVEAFPHPFTLQSSLPWSWPIYTIDKTMVPVHLSWVLLAFGAVEWWRSRREDAEEGWMIRGLGWTAVIGWVLTLGPHLVTGNGPDPDSHMPFLYLYGSHPALMRFWWPYRHGILVILAVAALAARAVSRLVDVLPPRIGFVVLAGVLFTVPAELNSRGGKIFVTVSRLRDEPAWVQSFRDLPDGLVLDLPLAPELWIGQQHLTLQQMHHHPLLDGHAMWVDRVRPSAWDDRIAGNSFLKELQRFERGAEDPDDPRRPDWFRYNPRSVAELADSGARWLVLWNELYSWDIRQLPMAEEQLLSQLFGAPVVTGEGLHIWDLKQHRGEGELRAPMWRMPLEVKLGDGSTRMTDHLPPSSLVELVGGGGG